MARRPLIAANWKMNKTIGEARAFCEALLPEVEGRGGGDPEVVICPPYLALPLVAAALRGRAGVGVAAQNMYFEDAGAYTGEVSAAMLLDAGADAVVLGHSERRQLFGETDEALVAEGARGARGRPAADPLRRRERGRARARRDRPRPAPPDRRRPLAGRRRASSPRSSSPTSRSGRSAPARPRRAEQAEDACGFIRSLIAARDERRRGADPDPVRRARSSPANAAELLGAERDRRGARRRRRARPRGLRRDRRRRREADER